MHRYARFYFEVTVRTAGRHVAVGWADALFTGSEASGVGDRHVIEAAESGTVSVPVEAQSWALRLEDGALRCSGETICATGVRCEPGDVVGCACYLDTGLLSFTIVTTRNGRREERVHEVGGVFPSGGLVPVITMDDEAVVLVNFGERPFSCVPSGDASMRHEAPGPSPSMPLLPISAWACMRKEELSLLEAGPTFATMQCKDGPNAVLFDRSGTMYAHDDDVIPTMVFEGICLTSGCWCAHAHADAGCGSMLPHRWRPYA